MLMHTVRRAAVVGFLTVGYLEAGARAAYADDVYCPPNGGDCYVIAQTPARPAGARRGDAATDSCAAPNGVCHDPVLGWWNPLDGCYYAKAQPQPPPGDPVWAGHQPADGAVYTRWCERRGRNGPHGVPHLQTGLVFLPAPPPGFGGLPSPAQLAARAVSQLPIRGPVIGVAPDDAPGSAGLVGLPVWLWTAVTAATWGPASATAAVPGLSVTATARAQKIVWSMGDGARVTCDNPGTPYQVAYGRAPSPTCGYPGGYQQPSSTTDGGRYTITGTTTWQVNWAGGGQAGVLTVIRSASTTVDVDELQVVTS